MLARFEFQQKAIVTHFASVAHSPGEFGEIDLSAGRPGRWRDLNGVASAERCDKLSASRGEEIVASLLAGWTVFRTFAQPEPRGRILPEVELQQRAMKLFELMGKYLQRLRHLMRGDLGDDR